MTYQKSLDASKIQREIARKSKIVGVFFHLQSPNVGQDVENLEASHTAGGYVNRHNHFGKLFGSICTT